MKSEDLDGKHFLKKLRCRNIFGYTQTFKLEKPESRTKNTIIDRKCLFKVNNKDTRTTSWEGRYFLTGFSSL